MNELRQAYDYIIGGLLCRVGQHGWKYHHKSIPISPKHIMTEYSKKCTRCSMQHTVTFGEYIRNIKECPDK